ncbi:hypothetical protein [Pontibacter harenae]|uniref:hypothetical protein n=1 Tax=Pontibacter harenae TaxID=2894083 RepID=UPI001E422B42|nr:hypothetical protein [Pontibacter harenae]MCC9168603.1 hypothetical protein [Pontibacter harenae]
MERYRYDRDRAYNGGYDNERYNDYNHENRPGRELKREFERDFQNSRGYNRDGEAERNQDYQDYQDRDRFDDYRSRDYDMEHNYYDNLRGDQGRLGDIRQGYGISSFDGTSDRYNTLNSMQRERNAQENQAYLSGRRDGFRSTRYGGGEGDADMHSNRGVPNYATRNFSDNYGTGMGSTYGGKNYGDGTGYMGGNMGGSHGHDSYGTSAGNYGGYGSLGSRAYGSGQSSSGGTDGFSDRGNFDDRGSNL